MGERRQIKVLCRNFEEGMWRTETVAEKVCLEKREDCMTQYPVFFPEDVEQMNRVLPRLAARLSEWVLAYYERILEDTRPFWKSGAERPEELLYRVLCNDIFYGDSFVLLEQLGLVKIQRSVVGYVCTPEVGRSYCTCAEWDNTGFEKTKAGAWLFTKLQKEILHVFWEMERELGTSERWEPDQKRTAAAEQWRWLMGNLSRQLTDLHLVECRV